MRVYRRGTTTLCHKCGKPADYWVDVGLYRDPDSIRMWDGYYDLPCGCAWDGSDPLPTDLIAIALLMGDP
jgi:predicted RNA-binding protein associated with RNAse of E/G family